MIRRFAEISAHDLPKVGGKGANLGVLTRAGFPVPPGFCITTDGFAAFVAGCAELPTLFADLDALPVDDVEAVRVVGAKVRAALLAVPALGAAQELRIGYVSGERVLRVCSSSWSSPFQRWSG